MPSRDSVNTMASWISAFAALVSLILGLIHQLSSNTLAPWVGPMVVGLWVLLPPIWFWSEWILFSRGLSPEERERIQHLQRRLALDSHLAGGQGGQRNEMRCRAA
jgi:hypothetical protein